MLEKIFDNLQEIRIRQLLLEAIVQEFIEDVSSHFDELELQITAIEKQDTFEKDLSKVKLESLKRRVIITTKRLTFLLEQQAITGLDTSYSVIHQIEQAEDEIRELQSEIRDHLEYGRS